MASQRDGESGSNIEHKKTKRPKKAQSMKVTSSILRRGADVNSR